MLIIFILLFCAVLIFCFFRYKNNMRKIITMYNNGNTFVFGLRGRGKDMLMSNIVARRRKQYCSNVDYKCGTDYHIFRASDFDCGGNSYKSFNGDLPVKSYRYSYSDGTDIYLFDCGTHFPAQYNDKLNKDYAGFATFCCLSRHLGACNVHVNAQSLNRVWDKLREQCDTYIYCMSCKVLFGGRLVVQRVRVYEKYDTALNHLPPFRCRMPLFGKDAKTAIKLAKMSYDNANGIIKTYTLIYRNKSRYDTRFFKSLMECNNNVND